MEVGSNSLFRRKRGPCRHTAAQTQGLEAFFYECQHPNERQRFNLGKELGLSPLQIKFWFQNKRTIVKAQYERLEGQALREENEKLKIENLAAIEALKCEFCSAGNKGLPNSSEQDQESILQQLRIENAQLIERREQLCSLIASMGISASKASFKSQIGSSSSSENLRDDHDNVVNDGVDAVPYHLWQLKMQDETYRARIMRIVSTALEELSSLFSVESLWIKDPIDGRFVIHRDNYEKTFSKNISSINCFKSTSPRARLESSKEEGIVGMNAAQLVDMLMDSTKRRELFPTIITKAITLDELGTQIPGSPNGSLQLVYEQSHILSPLVAPRDFYFLRYCEQTDEGTWMIVEVSYDILDESQSIPFSNSLRHPSGCFVRDLSNGCSMITWVECVKVDDRTLTHRLYRDLMFRGLAYGAERWVSSLRRMCQRFAYEYMESQELGGVICFPEGRRSIMNLTQRMVKNLCSNLTMKQKLDISHLLELKNSQIRVSCCKSIGVGQSVGLILNFATSFRLPLSPQVVFDFFRNEKMRAKWDVNSRGNPSQEIGSISYGDHPGNRISIIQPFMPSDNNMLMLQESCIDPLGGIVAYAMIDIKSLDMVISGADSSSIPIIPSGFIISNDGQPDTRASTSSSTNTTHSSGSLLTVSLQMLDCDALSSKEVNMELVTCGNSLMMSTIENIKSALNCNGVN